MFRSKTSTRLNGLLGVGLTLGTADALAAWSLNLSPGVTPISRAVFDLHTLLMWVCVVIAIGVFGVMFWSILHHRKSKGAVAAKFTHSTIVEVVWTTIPFLILIGTAIPATKAIILMEETGEAADITIKVTGYQWKWKYEYVDEDVSFFSNLAATSREVRNGGDPSGVKNYLLEVDNELVVPVNKRIRFLITADDVIHSWWIPAFGMKRDAIPGFMNEMWASIDTPGTYRGQCAELCGKDHGYMPIVVVAKSESEYRQWIAEKQGAAKAEQAAAGKSWGKAELLARGEQVYNTACAACHQANGAGLPGVFPAITGSAIVTGSQDGHLDIVMNGKKGTAMQAFAAQLSDTDIAAVVSYQRNALGNSVGDSVQPSDVKAKRH